MADDINDLLAIEKIRRLKARYFRSIDQDNWDAFRDVFADDATIDIADDIGPDANIDGPDAFVSMIRPILEPSTTLHQGHMSEIDITGPDSAEAIWAMEDHLWLAEEFGGSTMWGTGWYEETYRVVDGQWKIASMKIRRQRVETDGVQTFPQP